LIFESLLLVDKEPGVYTLGQVMKSYPKGKMLLGEKEWKSKNP
jgi:hypothetical protein